MCSLGADQFDVVRTPDEVASIRAKAIKDAKALRALAFVALRDGMPHAVVRATNARAAARSVLGFARRLSEKAGVRAVEAERLTGSDLERELEPT